MFKFDMFENQPLIRPDDATGNLNLKYIFNAV